MPRNFPKTDTTVDPVAIWYQNDFYEEDEPVEKVIAAFDAAEKGRTAPPLVPNITTAVNNTVPDTPEELAGLYCSQCGEKSTAVAKYCSACGSALRPAPVSGAGVMAEMAARVTTRPDLNQFRPKREEDLTPAEKAERQRQHAAAVAAGNQDPPRTYIPSKAPDKILIHIVEDGFTFAGEVWMRGQELEIGPDHPRWGEVQRWINMDDFQQMEVYGKIRFRRGPWPGRRSFADGADSFEKVMVGTGEHAQQYKGPSVAELLKADQKERQRGRAVPAPTF